MKYNQNLQEEMLEESKNLMIRVDKAEKELDMLPKGSFLEKEKNGHIYFYLIQYNDGKKQYIYIKNEDADCIKNQLKERERKENYIKKMKAESSDYANTVLMKRYIPKMDAVKNYLEDERQRKIKILGAYRNEEVKALSISDESKRQEYKNIADNIEKSVMELNKLLLIGV